jgi:radical SAM superfamily enzyme YgiQ (UPF0313 family)
MQQSSNSPRALLIQPPVYDFALYDLFFKPYGLLRIGRWLEEHGWRVEYLNALDYRDAETNARLGAPRRNANGTGKFPKREIARPSALEGVPRRYSRYGILPEVLERRIAASGADAVFLTSQMTYWYPGVAEAAAAVRAGLPGVPLFVGGVYATLMPDHCRRVTAADAVLPGPAERSLPGVLEEFGLPGPAGYPPADPLIRREIWNPAGVLRINRGCPYSCDYCASARIEPRFQSRDPGELFATIERMYRECGSRHFAFYDDALLVNRQRALLPLLEQLLRSDLSLAFYTPNAVHVREVDGESAELMYRAGFREVRLGYESADAEFHRRTDRKYSAAELEPAIAALRKAGFDGRQIVLYVLAGLPGQQPEEVEESIRAAASLGTRVSLAEYSPVPGTPMWDASLRASPYDLAGEPLLHNNTVFPLEHPGFTRRELERLKQLSRVLCDHPYL